MNLYDHVPVTGKKFQCADGRIVVGVGFGEYADSDEKFFRMKAPSGAPLGYLPDGTLFGPFQHEPGNIVEVVQ